MSDPVTVQKERIVKVGRDRVIVTADEVFVDARREMPDWQMLGSKTPAIFFEGKKHVLCDKRDGDTPYEVRYVLRPWPEGRSANSVRIITYDEDAVKERDSLDSGQTLDEVIWICLLPLFPFLGYLWSGTQHWLNRFGYVARTITGVSIFTSFVFSAMQVIFTSILLNASGRSGKMMIGGVCRALAKSDHLQLGPIGISWWEIDLALFIVFGLDVLIRYTKYLREDQWTGGFFEWLVPNSLRKN